MGQRRNEDILAAVCLAQRLLSGAQLGLSALRAIDIGARSKPPENRTCAVAVGGRTCEEPAVRAVCLTQPKLVLIRLAGLQRLGPAVVGTITVVSMQELGPAVDVNGWRHSRKAVPAFIHILNRALGATDPNQLRYGVGQRCEAPLAFHESLFGCLAQSDILDDADEVLRRACLVFEQRNRQVCPHHVAILVEITLFHRVRRRLPRQ